MQPRRKKVVLSAKRTSQICETLTTMKDLAERNYLTLVRLYSCSMNMQADNIVERNITSSDVEFLEGEDEEKKDNGKATRKGKDKPEKGKDKPENTRVLIDKARHMLTTSDLSESGLQADVEMNDNRSVT